MEIVISDQFNISDMQQAFQQAFPYLKLEFFAQTHHPQTSTTRFIRIHTNTFGELRKQQDAGQHRSIAPDMTVTELEALFGTHYGLGAQVFRKCGRVWLETTVTDGWTLEEQNKEGEALCREISAG